MSCNNRVCPANNKPLLTLLGLTKWPNPLPPIVERLCCQLLHAANMVLHLAVHQLTADRTSSGLLFL